MPQDPFRGGDNIIVMADAHEPPRDVDGKHVDMKPIPTNTRFACAEAMEKGMKEEPWFGIEQVQMSPRAPIGSHMLSSKLPSPCGRYLRSSVRP